MPKAMDSGQLVLWHIRFFWYCNSCYSPTGTVSQVLNCLFLLLSDHCFFKIINSFTNKALINNLRSYLNTSWIIDIEQPFTTSTEQKFCCFCFQLEHRIGGQNFACFFQLHQLVQQKYITSFSKLCLFIITALVIHKKWWQKVLL